ncbi:hypothetical protein Dsin_022467 [Dipteronia sinensis]|uniref:Uncharacterized protein n=1 Tax=Dipteronia sinensis TaxID=43782 RepID=A0AAE0A2F0_9ROSI|nr:hypothetical protein Dsin_022467 [Dipteronia sinensis]
MADRFFSNEMPDFVPETSTTNSTLSDTPKKLSFRYPTENTYSLHNMTHLSFNPLLFSHRVIVISASSSFILLHTTRVLLGLLTWSLKLINLPRRVTFICGRAGVCALGAVLAKHAGDERQLNRFLQIKLPSDLPNELLYGRVGFLSACTFLNKHIGDNTISATRMRAVVDEIVKDDRRLANKVRCPLMYERHG